MQGEVCCQKFIKQDLTFLQDSQIYPNRQPTSLTATSSNPLEKTELDIEQETQQKILHKCTIQSPPLDFIYDKERSVKPKTPVLPVEPVLGLTPEQQEKRNQDPQISLNELLGLSSCKEYIQMPLQTLDGLYVKQPSHFLLLATEAKKSAEKLKEEERASQWAGVPPEKLLSF